MLHFRLAFLVPGLHFSFTRTEAVFQFEEPPVRFPLLDHRVFPGGTRIGLDYIPLSASGPVRVGVAVTVAIHPLGGGVPRHRDVARHRTGHRRQSLPLQPLDFPRRDSPLAAIGRHRPNHAAVAEGADHILADT